MNKILIIDHDESFRTSLAATLTNQGFEVIQAGTGTQGVQMARTQSPNLILCDVDLQGLGGNLILYAVRRDPKLASLPFVLMSRFAVAEASPEGIQKGADAFLAKPFSPSALAITIGECLSAKEEHPDAAGPTSGEWAGNTDPCSRSGLLDSLRPVLEATRRISTAYQQLELTEIVALATQAHQAVSQLYRRIEHWLPVESGA
jgi:CheY-like chemotaxis protein